MRLNGVQEVVGSNPAGPRRSEVLRLLRSVGTSCRAIYGGFEPDEVASDNASRRLGKWCEIAAKGDGDRFRQTLRLAGLSEPDVLPLLGKTKLRCGSPLSRWAERLPRILELIKKGNGNRLSEPTARVPFIHLFLPLGRGLGDGIMTHCQRSRWSDSAIEDLACGLACRIVPLFACMLQSWFERFRAVMGPRIDGARIDPHGPPTTLIYDAYLNWLRNGHLIRLFEKRPVLARLLAVAAEQWEQFVLELVSRLDADFSAIVAHFFDCREPGRVLRLQLNNSDPHNGGQSVAILQFSSGERLVYKPRDLSTERAWGDLCGWLKVMRAPHEFPTTKVWRGQGYGWVSCVDAAPCRDEADGRAFFRRAGGLLSLIHALGGTDFHNENVVAAGAYVIPIDLETILRPKIGANSDSTKSHPALFTAQQLVANSVLASGYLPGWHEFRGKSWAVGGLRDNLCCGNFGRFELLFYAGSQLLQPRLVALARERAAIRLRETERGFCWPVGTDAENLGFFQGLAGIGYELLRLAEPNKIPCALLWQS